MRAPGWPVNFWVFLFVALVGIPILTGNFVTGACIGAICLVVFANAMVVRQNAAEARDLAEHLASKKAAPALLSHEAIVLSPAWHDNTLIRSEFIITQHTAELLVRRRQLTVTSNYGLVDDSQWLQEVEFFIDEVIEKSGGEVRSSPARLGTVRRLIDTVTAGFASSRAPFSPDMDPIDYEQMVADSLTDLGWVTRLTKASGDEGIDVIAEMRGKRVVIQCKRYASPIGNSAAQEVFAGKSFEDADYAAVVTNTEFTRSARQLADTTQVVLLHHDELSKLELQVFGTVAPNRIAAKNPSSEVAAPMHMTPVCYEQAVADGLKKLGWDTRLKESTEDRYADVIAGLHGRRVLIQCWGFMPPCIPTVQEIREAKSVEHADFAAIVSNAEFTPNGHQLARSVGVILLRHDNLDELESRILGISAQQNAIVAHAA
jgi:restriction system protein